MEDKDYFINTDWYKQCLDHCESFGISRTFINLFIHLQEQNDEQNYKKTSNSRIQTKVIVNPRKYKSSIVTDDVQLSLDFNKDEKRDSEN